MSNEYKECWHMNNPRVLAYEKWRDNNEVPWDTAAVCETVRFAAERMIQMLPPDDELCDTMHDSLYDMNKADKQDTAELAYIFDDMYVTSVKILSNSFNEWGVHRMNEWMPVFQEYQGMISCASREMKKKEDMSGKL